MQEGMQSLHCKDIPAGRVGATTEGRSKLFKASQIKSNLAYSGTLDFCGVGNDLLPGNLGVICQYRSQSMEGRENEGQVTLTAA